MTHAELIDLYHELCAAKVYAAMAGDLLTAMSFKRQADRILARIGRSNTKLSA